MRDCRFGNRTARGVLRSTPSDSMAPCPQPSHQRLSGVAYPADQELQHDHVLRHGARGAARGRERRQGRARGTLLALRDPSGDDAGNRGATSVPTDGPAAYDSCKESCGQEDRGEEDGEEAGAERPVRQGSSREAPGPPFVGWKSLGQQTHCSWSTKQRRVSSPRRRRRGRIDIRSRARSRCTEACANRLAALRGEHARASQRPCSR
jgi:hypothetical protein